MLRSVVYSAPYNAGYLASTSSGTAANYGIDFAAYERGLMAGRVALWCGVSLFIAN